MLRCEECDAVATDDARGWAAHRFPDPDEPERILVVVYCPACVLREFGDSTPQHEP